MFRLVDLDNCIADDAWRIPRVDFGQRDLDRRYHTYHSLSAFDEARNLDLVDTPNAIVIMTARPVMYRAMTEEWMKRKRVPFSLLIMRNNGDHAPSADMKAKQLSWLISHYGVSIDKIEKAFDDLPEVVEMYRRFGIDAEVRKIHDMEAA